MVEQAQARPQTSRIPPGQKVTDKFPILTFGRAPALDLETWRLGLFGLVEELRELTWKQFMALPQTAITADFHCVTQWSRLDDHWEGVLFRDVIRGARPLAKARAVMVHCHGGFTTNVELATLMGDDVILARQHNGKELTPDHGWPLRLVVPSRYAWKSAKWVMGLEFMEENAPGFYEKRGYNLNADPWLQERFWPEFDMDFYLTIAVCSDKL